MLTVAPTFTVTDVKDYEGQLKDGASLLVTMTDI